MSDNIAVLDGYTQELLANRLGKETHILVKPDTNFRELFKAWNCDEQKYIYLEGWLYTFEPV